MTENRSRGTMRTRKCTSFTAKEKLNIILKLNNSTTSEISEEYGIPCSTLRRWRKEQTKIEKCSQSSPGAKRLRPSGNSRVNEAVFSWFADMRFKGLPISGPMIQAKAREFHEKLGGEPNFKASEGWLSYWKSKFGIRQLSLPSGNNSVNEAAAIKFKEEFVKFIATSGYHPSQIFNADHTGLNFKMMPTKTLIIKEESAECSFKRNEGRVTIMPCCNADGSLKIPLLVIGKSAKSRVIKNTASYSLPVTYTHQKSALMDCHIFDDWFKTQFAPQVLAFLDEQHLPRKAILLLDNAVSYPPQETLNIDGITVMYLCPNVTSLIQPMDQGIIEILKKKYKTKLLMYILNCQDEGISLPESLKSITIETVIDWLSNTWYEIDAYMIRKCWKQLMPSLYFTNMEDHQFHSHENIATLFHHLREYTDISSDVINDWIQYDDREPPTDDEIMEEMNCCHVEDNNDPEIIIKEENDEKIKLSQALMGIKTVIEYFEQCGNISAAEMNILQQLRDRLFMSKILTEISM